MKRMSSALTLAAFLIAASPPLFARDDGAPAPGSGGLPDATAPTPSTAPADSRVSPERDTATSPSYDRMDEGTMRDKKARKSKERNPNAATPATPADPTTGTPAVPATPSNRETTP